VDEYVPFPAKSIVDHAYDAGSPRDDSQGCIVQIGSNEAFVVGRCGRPESEHESSEYLGSFDGHQMTFDMPLNDNTRNLLPPEEVHESAMDRARRGRGGRGKDLPPGKFERAVGDMHEPKPYTGELDWDNDHLLHPFID
jgi:hypothetical protein